MVDVGRPAVQVQHRAEHHRGTHAVLSVVAESRDDALLVMVVPVQAVPANLGQTCLPSPKDRLEVAQAERANVPERAPAVNLDVLELEDHVHFAAGWVGVEFGLIDRDARHLADSDQIFSSGEDVAVHLLEELVDAGLVEEVRHPVAVEAAVAHVAVG